ncbi:uncharacterized protein [Spinacia oleracea]|uniref:Uncharacterized protein isoform X1 n=1 Tax=Spinacia oleracea TaxID=3562 RepID=A0ABM3R0M5_SPIOL|nr:uncharacterized protein LOC130463918 isoform X1 [Spinacia oleracea]
MDEYNGNLVVVADGNVEPWPNDLVHHTKMMETHYKVGVDSEFGEIDLPVPTPDGLTKLGETEGSYLQWPKELVLFDDEEMVTPPPKKKAKPHHGKGSEKGSTKGSCVLKKGSGSKNKDTSKSDNPIGSKVDGLRVECELLSYMMSNMPKFSSALSHPASIFSYKKDTLTSVKSRDISEFLTKDFAGIKVLQVYMMYLYHEYICPLKLSHINFLCPDAISCAAMKKNRLSVIDYIKDAFLNERKKDVQSKFLLAPYHEGNHWVLIVLDLVLGLAYVFDSATPPPPGTRKLEGFNCIQMVMYKEKCHILMRS